MKIQADLRKAVVKQIKKHPQFTRLDKKELIRDDLVNFVQNAEEKELVLEFHNFTTYFTGFHENRKNMYSDEEKSTAIAYRIVHQNLPKFIDNLKAFEKVKTTTICAEFSNMENELKNILQGNRIEEIFQLDYFSHTLTQSGIERYNNIIGGYVNKEDPKIKYKGINEYINLYNQKVPKAQRVGKLNRLLKQILSDRESISFLPEVFENDQAVLDAIRIFHEQVLDGLLHQNGGIGKSLTVLLENMDSYDLNRIYIRNDVSLTDISQKMFGEWGVLQQGLHARYDAKYTGKNKNKPEKYEEERKKYFSALGKGENEKNLEEVIEEAYGNIQNLLHTDYPQNTNLSQDTVNVEMIKAYLDSVKALQWFIKPLLGKGTEPEKDERFYGDFAAAWIALDQVTPLYNSVRNYMTKKPFSDEKIKLNFENPELLGGWPREIATSSLLFKDANYYYLGIMDKKCKASLKNWNNGEGSLFLMLPNMLTIKR